MKKIIENLPEIILILGLFFIILPSFLISIILGFFVTGFTLSGLGIFLAMEPTKKNKRG